VRIRVMIVARVRAGDSYSNEHESKGDALTLTFMHIAMCW
jgi:hypothetical protein